MSYLYMSAICLIGALGRKSFDETFSLIQKSTRQRGIHDRNVSETTFATKSFTSVSQENHLIQYINHNQTSVIQIIILSFVHI